MLEEPWRLLEQEHNDINRLGIGLENHVSRICGDLDTRYLRTASKMGRRLGNLYSAAIKVFTGVLWRFYRSILGVQGIWHRMVACIAIYGGMGG